MTSDSKPADVHTRSSRESWPVRTIRGGARVLSRLNFLTGEEVLHAPPPTTAQLTAWVRDPFHADSVRKMFEGAYGHSIPRQSMHPKSGWLVGRLEDAFRRGRLILTHGDVIPASAGGAVAAEDEAAPAAAGPPLAEAEEKTWFHARLVDEDGEPMAKEDYIVIDTDGARRQGKLDDNGEIYIPAVLPPGNCTISFPNIHLNPRKRK